MNYRFANFTIKKQGEADSACGLYCVLSAALHLFRDSYDVHERAVFRNLARSKGLSNALFRSGVMPASFRNLAQAAGLAMKRPKNVGISTFRSMNDDAVWVAAVRMLFQNVGKPVCGDAVVPTASDRGDQHYVLVVGVSEQHVTVADPHPWHEDVYELQLRSFMKCWRLARPKGGSLWAAELTAR